jgi:hypothetical protein
MWIPSRVGIKGNEMADEAASLASKNCLMTPLLKYLPTTFPQ